MHGRAFDISACRVCLHAAFGISLNGIATYSYCRVCRVKDKQGRDDVLDNWLSMEAVDRSGRV